MKQLFQEAHKRSLWQVLGIYMAGSWGVLQVVDQLTESAGLPEWVPSFALVLLLVIRKMLLCVPAAASAGMKRLAARRVSGAPGMSTNVVMVQEMNAAMVITKVTAAPMPTAMSTCRDTPMKGQIPTK